MARLCHCRCRQYREDDFDSGVARIQYFDAVNVVGVGACDSLGKKWKRASYSSLGPGRTPGIMKARFASLWWISSRAILGVSSSQSSDPDRRNKFCIAAGTPNALGIARTSAQSCSHALKALLVHHSEDNDTIAMRSVGKNTR